MAVFDATGLPKGSRVQLVKGSGEVDLGQRLNEAIEKLEGKNSRIIGISDASIASNADGRLTMIATIVYLEPGNANEM